MCRLFPCIPILGGFLIKKFLKKCVCVVGVKISLLLVKNVFINVTEGKSELGRWVAAKHTTFKLLPLAFRVLKITEILR